MKKATTKRDRKYGKKDENDSEVAKPAKRAVKKPKVLDKDKTGVFKLMVDYAHIIKFKTQREREDFIKEHDEESKRTRKTKTSFIIV